MIFTKLAGKKLVWTKYLRVFTDNGQPKFTLFPKFRYMNYSPYWQMMGFSVCWLGREFNFSFKEDVNNLYDNHFHSRRKK